MSNRCEKSKNSLFSVEQAIDAAKWDKKSTWAEIIKRTNDGPQKSDPQTRRRKEN